jgi:hypothetical protein
MSRTGECRAAPLGDLVGSMTAKRTRPPTLARASGFFIWDVASAVGESHKSGVNVRVIASHEGALRMNFRHRLLDPLNIVVALLGIMFISSVLADLVH